MVFSPPPDMLYQTIHPITGVVTTYTQMVGSDLSWARASAAYEVFSGDGGIDPFGSGPAPLKIRTFKFDYLHTYQAGETFTTQRDKLMQAVGHGYLTTFLVKCGDGSIRKGAGKCNLSDMKETRDAMVLFSATITFECVNPYLTDQYESGTIRWDNGLSWDVGHAVYQLAASAQLTGGTYKLTWAGNQTPAINSYDNDQTITQRLAQATPVAIPFTAFSSALQAGPYTLATPVPVILSATSPGVSGAITVTPTAITGGTLGVTTIQAGSAATPQLWDFTPNFVAVTSTVVNFTVTAAGNASDREVIITATGPMNAGYVIYNASLPGGAGGYMAFSINEALAAGESHTFDMGRQSVRKQSGANSFSSWQYFYLPPGQDDWFRIDPGPNVISIQQPNVVTTQVGATTIGATSMVVASAAAFFAGDGVIVGAETVRVIAINYATNTLTVSATTANHANGVAVTRQINGTFKLITRAHFI